MRRFIITNPNLSVGRSGDVVTAAQLGQTDEQLDEFVAAGLAFEIEADTYEEIPGETVLSADEVREANGLSNEPPDGELVGLVYDPADHTVTEVLAHIADHPDDADAIIDAEIAGKNRTGIVGSHDD